MRTLAFSFLLNLIACYLYSSRHYFLILQIFYLSFRLTCYICMLSARKRKKRNKKNEKYIKNIIFQLFTSFKAILRERIRNENENIEQYHKLISNEEHFGEFRLAESQIQYTGLEKILVDSTVRPPTDLPPSYFHSIQSSLISHPSTRLSLPNMDSMQSRYFVDEIRSVR